MKEGVITFELKRGQKKMKINGMCRRRRGVGCGHPLEKKSGNPWISLLLSYSCLFNQGLIDTEGDI